MFQSSEAFRKKILFSRDIKKVFLFLTFQGKDQVMFEKFHKKTVIVDFV